MQAQQQTDMVDQGCCSGGGRCCEEGKCCKFPQGKFAAIASALAITAFATGIMTIAVIESLIAMVGFGLTAMLMLICTACKVLKKCTLIVAAVFCFLTAAMKIVDAALFEAWELCGYYECREWYKSSRYHYSVEANNNSLTALSVISAI